MCRGLYAIRFGERLSKREAASWAQQEFPQWAARGRVRAKTYDGYFCLIRLYALPRLGSVALGEVVPLSIQRLYGELLARGLSGGTILNLHLVLTQTA